MTELAAGVQEERRGTAELDLLQGLRQAVGDVVFCCDVLDEDHTFFDFLAHEVMLDIDVLASCARDGIGGYVDLSS